MDHNLDYVACPLPEDVRRVIDHGDLAYARHLIGRRIADTRTPEVLRKRLFWELRTLEVLPEEYPMDEGTLLARLGQEIEGFTEQELIALREEGTLDWIYLDGQIRYHALAADTALTLSAFAPRRRDREAAERDARHRTRLDAVISEMKAEGHARYRFRLRTEAWLDSAYERPGEPLLLHLPLPVCDAQCKPGAILAAPGAVLAAEREPQRTASWRAPCELGKVYWTEAEWEIDAPYVEPDAQKVSADQPAFDLEEQLPQIALTPFVRQLARELAGEERNPLLKARRFYDYITTRCAYRYVPPYAIVPCIPEYFGAGGRGDCGMHALLFIALCRAGGIPAQWQSGLYTPPWGSGMHDWARFYVEPYGWLYVDGSFGGSAYRAGNLERWNFYFGNLDPWRAVYNSALQQTFDPPKAHLRFDPYDSQTVEAEYADGGLPRKAFTVRRELLVCQKI